jgi:hypothetical protein
MWNQKGLWIAKTILKGRNKLESLTPSDFKSMVLA